MTVHDEVIPEGVILGRVIAHLLQRMDAMEKALAGKVPVHMDLAIGATRMVVTREIQAEMIRLSREGRSAVYIGRATGFSTATVYNQLHRAGVNRYNQT